MMMRRVGVMAMALALAQPGGLSAGTYRCVDAQGQPHFSDVPCRDQPTPSPRLLEGNEPVLSRPTVRLSPTAREQNLPLNCEQATQQYRIAAGMLQSDKGLVAAQKRRMQEVCAAP